MKQPAKRCWLQDQVSCVHEIPILRGPFIYYVSTCRGKGGGWENAYLCLFKVLKTFLRKREGVQKSQKCDYVIYEWSPVKDYITTSLSKFRYLKTKKSYGREKKWTNGNGCKVSQVLHVIFHFDQIWIFGNFRQSETNSKQRCLDVFLVFSNLSIKKRRNLTKFNFYLKQYYLRLIK